MNRYVHRLPNNERGFTLPELLVATLLITLLLLGAALVLRPKTFDAESRNAKRQIAVVKVVEALDMYKLTHGSWPSEITTKAQPIGSESGQADICKDLVPSYIKDLPLDPSVSITNAANTCADADTIYVTGYSVVMSSDAKHVTVSAPYAETGAHISFTR